MSIDVDIKRPLSRGGTSEGYAEHRGKRYAWDAFTGTSAGATYHRVCLYTTGFSGVGRDRRVPPNHLRDVRRAVALAVFPDTYLDGEVLAR